MKSICSLALTLVMVACTHANSERAMIQSSTNSPQASAAAMEVSRSATRQPGRGPDDWFTGATSITPLFNSNESSEVGAALVRFEPGARTAWHKHPLGQRLFVLEGVGWTQVEGGAVEVIRAGDVVWCPPDTRHWHGATPTTAMAHIAIQESQNGSPVTWMEHVTDAQYQRGVE